MTSDDTPTPAHLLHADDARRETKSELLDVHPGTLRDNEMPRLVNEDEEAEDEDEDEDGEHNE